MKYVINFKSEKHGTGLSEVFTGQYSLSKAMSICSKYSNHSFKQIGKV